MMPVATPRSRLLKQMMVVKVPKTSHLPMMPNHRHHLHLLLLTTKPLNPRQMMKKLRAKVNKYLQELAHNNKEQQRCLAVVCLAVLAVVWMISLVQQ
jgi:hypothetical protein